MLPDFVKIKKQISKSFIKYISASQMNTALMQGIRKDIHFEGNKHGYSEPGEQDQGTEYQRFSSTLEISNDELIKKGIDAYADKIVKLTEELQNQTERSMLAEISRSTDKTGNVIDAKGKELDQDVFLEIYENIQLDFDKHGTRPRNQRIEVWTTPEEKETIETNAKRCRSRSVSAYLRELGQGYQPKSLFDLEFIEEMMDIKADQGRLGGLLKLWLSEKPGEGTSVRNVRSVLNQIEANQQQMARLILKECKKL